MDSGTTQMFYDPKGRHKTKEVNPILDTIHYFYDDNGNMTSQKDPNNLITSTTYDGWGKPLTSVDPSSTVATQSVDWADGGDAPMAAVYFSSSTMDGRYNGASYYDGLGRVIREVSVGLEEGSFTPT